MGSRVQCSVCWSPWQLRPDQRNLMRLVVLAAEADQGVVKRTSRDTANHEQNGYAKIV